MRYWNSILCITIHLALGAFAFAADQQKYHGETLLREFVESFEGTWTDDKGTTRISEWDQKSKTLFERYYDKNNPFLSIRLYYFDAGSNRIVTCNCGDDPDFCRIGVVTKLRDNTWEIREASWRGSLERELSHVSELKNQNECITTSFYFGKDTSSQPEKDKWLPFQSSTMKRKILSEDNANEFAKHQKADSSANPSIHIGSIVTININIGHCSIPKNPKTKSDGEERKGSSGNRVIER